jgi:hypothetical protein
MAGQNCLPHGPEAREEERGRAGVLLSPLRASPTNLTSSHQALHLKGSTISQSGGQTFFEKNFFNFYVVLGFELRASHLLGKHSSI